MNREGLLLAAAAVLVALLIVTGIHPYDRVTWALEVFPVVLALPVLGLTHRRFPLTDVLYIGVPSFLDFTRFRRHLTVTRL